MLWYDFFTHLTLYHLKFSTAWHTKSWQYQRKLELSPGAFNSSDDVGLLIASHKQFKGVLGGRAPLVLALILV